MEKKEATYQYLEESHGNGMFYYTSCCGNRMYSVDKDPMKYHGCLCPKCFWNNKLVTLYLRGTPDGIRVFENEHKDKEWEVEATIEIRTSFFCDTKEEAEKEAHKYLEELCTGLYPDCCSNSYEIENIYSCTED